MNLLLFLLLPGDVKGEANLTELLKGSDTVLSVIGGPSLFDDSQDILVRAAKVRPVSLLTDNKQTTPTD